MSLSEERQRTGAGQWLLLVLLFAGAAALFTQLLRPLVESAQAKAPAPVAAVETAAPAAVTVASAAQVGTPAPPPPVAPAPPPPYAPDFKGPRVAIILTDVGDNPAQARAAIAALPSNIGLAFTPYPDVLALTRSARADGHEIWAGVPMQPKSWPRVTPGRNTLLVDASAGDNVRGLDWALARVGGDAAGFTGIMGSAFTESEAALRPVLEEAARRGLAYIDARASARSVGPAIAKAAGVRTAVNDRFLDESGTIAGNLAALEQLARREGQAIGYARPLPTTVAALQAWAATLEDKGILLVPPSSLAE